MAVQQKNMWSSKIHNGLKGLKCFFTTYNHLLYMNGCVLHLMPWNWVAVALTMWSCWPALWGRLDFWSACPRLWQSGQTLAFRYAPSPSSPAWVGATQQDSPSGREDDSPHLLLWSPAGKWKQWSVVERRPSFISKQAHAVWWWWWWWYVTHILVGHLPVGSLSIWDHFPHDNTVAPHITGWGELPEGNGLWCRPSDWDLASLQKVQNLRSQNTFVFASLIFIPICNSVDHLTV